MKTTAGHVVLAASLALLGFSAPKTLGQSVSWQGQTGLLEKTRVRVGLDKLGIGPESEIVVANEHDLVETTAAKVLQRFLARASLSVEITPESRATGKRRIFLGRDANLRIVKQLGDRGELSIRNVPAEDDAFHLKRIGRDIVIAGANPRGVLYGVYALEDFIADGAESPLDIKRIPHFRKRSNTKGYYFNAYGGEFTRQDAEYLSRLGVNQYTSCDGSGVMSHLHELVQSDIFPFQKPPVAEYRRKVKSIAALCKEYGIDFYLMLWEPIVPQLGADIAKYPPEALGTVRRPWGGGKDGMDRTLCISSPIVQEHYRGLVKKFVHDFSDVKGFFFYNMDGATWLCTPSLCPRCAAAVKDSDHDLFNPWEIQSRLVSLLAEAAHEERSEFKFNFWGAVHFHGEDVRKLLQYTPGYDALSTGWDGSDHDIMITLENRRPCAEVLMTQTAAEARGVPMYVYFAYNRLESVPQGLPFPFHVSASIKKFKEWGVENLIEVTGPTPEFNSINALTMREFQSNPDTDPEWFLAALATRQFGPAAGKLMFRAWAKIKTAMDTWNGYSITPLSGSQGFLSIGTLFGVPPAILPGIAEDFDQQIAVRIRVEPWRASGYQRFKEPAFLEKMERMHDHLVKAANLSGQAAVAASDQEFIDIAYYTGPGGRPTRRQYAELNHAPITLAAALCQQRINIVRAYHLLTEMGNAQADGDTPLAHSKEKLYLELLREDIAVQEHFAGLLMGFAAMHPCYTRTSLTDREITNLLAATRGKIENLKAHLASR
ncbi:MAG: hypothetical protein K1X42_04935 [Opitutaceae bacterium]|nr:hypothetical protein [Opitutaceae bacterium]